MQNIVIYVTAKDRKEGRKIAQHLLTRKLVACVNLIPGVESHYHWQGKIERAKEILLVMKTRTSHFAKVVKAVQSIHTYQVPEIIALPIVAGEKKYLAWIASETQ